MTDDPFRSTLKNRLQRAFASKSVDAAANVLFGSIVDRYSENLEDLKEDLKKANMEVLFRTYVSKALLYATIASLLGIIAGASYIASTSLNPTSVFRFLFGLPVALWIIVFGGFYLYPSQKAKSRKKNIEENLPFALNHLSAIATSGIPPSSMFELVETFDEYGAIADEAGKISRRVNVFGEDFTTALREVADEAPSEDWAEILYGLLSTVETGGSLEGYLKEKSEEVLFEFQLEREKEIERLSTYASFYTAILIAAPVFLVTVLSIMNLLGGQLLGFAIRDLMWLGVHVIIPVLNLLFIIFLVAKVD